MNRLSVRLLASHVLVAIVAAVTTYLVVRLAAPALFDESVRHAGGFAGRGGQGRGQGLALRRAFTSAVETATLVGVLVGVTTAAIAGAFAARRVLGPLHRIRAATRRIAAGNYDEPVRRPRDRELAALADDVTRLGQALHHTETTRVRLLGEVAHEMRTPLTVIDGYLDGMADGVLPTTGDNLDLLRAESARLCRLADDLSALSRGAEHRLEMDRHIQPVAPVVREAAQRLEQMAHEADVVLHVESTDDHASARIDAERMAQVVTNLVRNAIQATPPRGVVDVRTVADSGHIRVTVSDTGCGLAPQDLAAIFERFYRVRLPHGQRNVASHGSGIGLTIARDIVRAHDGELTASSQGLGAGAKFEVRLPGEGAAR